MKQAGRVVIITGAAGGIGRALVEIVAADGDIVVAVDLPGSGVLELAGGLGHPHLASNAMSHEKRTLSPYTAASKRSSRKSMFSSTTRR